MTDAERLDRLREMHLTPKGTHECYEKCTICFLLSQLDAITESHDKYAYEALIGASYRAMFESTKKELDIARQTIAEKDAEIYGWLDFERWAESKGLSMSQYVDEIEDGKWEHDETYRERGKRAKPRMTREDIYKLIDIERKRQDTMHPQWKGDAHGLSVLMEEVGEAAKGLYESNNATDEASEKWWNDNLESELIQVAATAIRWLENRR